MARNPLLIAESLLNRPDKRITDHKFAVVTIAIGTDPSYQYGLASIRKYAQRVGAKLVVVRNPIVNVDGLSDPRHIAWLQKLYALSLVSHFESILYVDADVLITPYAPDIFQLMTSLGAKCAMYDEGHLGRRHYVTELKRFASQRLPENLFGTYFNAGVIYLNNQSDLSSALASEDVKKVMLGGVSCPEQTWLNYLMWVMRTDVSPLGREFNFMDEREGDNLDRFKAYFIHYAGYSFRTSKRQKRVDVMRSDFKEIFECPGFWTTVKYIVFAACDKARGVHWSISKKIIRLSVG